MCNECNSDAFLKALTMGMPTSESAALFERVVRESTWHYNWDVPGFATVCADCVFLLNPAQRVI